VEVLCRLNGISKSAPLKPGQTIKTGVASVYADAGDVATDDSKGESSSSSIGFASDPRRPGSSAVAYYTVSRNGTLKDVSKKTGIPLSSLCQLNGLSRNAHLKAGQKIKLTQGGSRFAATTRKGHGSSSSICFDSVSKKPDSPTAAYYTVNNGGTLKDVSKKTGIPLSSLCQLNGLSRDAHLKSGQRIKLTQANLPVKPALGAASCSVKDSMKKSQATKHGKSDKKSSKQTEAKAVEKPASKSGPSKSSAQSKSKPGPAKAAAAKPAVKQTPKSAAAQRKAPDTKSVVSKSKVKEAQKQSAKHTTLAKR
jgi:LysM repeat protein